MSELIIEAKAENMYTLLEFISREVSGSAKIRNTIYIAVDEILTNVARYAKPNKVNNATIRVLVEDSITLEFCDSGSKFNPLVDMLGDDEQTDKNELFGFGLYMTRNMMDSVEYHRDGEKNILTMKMAK